MRTKTALLLTTLTALAGLSGCASMSGDECLTSDWGAVGFEDGSRGHTADRIGQHRKACAKHGVTPDLQAYNTGREKGLVDYCQPSRGFDVGERGNRYKGVCSSHNEAAFLEAYNAGYQLHTLRTDVNKTTNSISSKKSELKRIDKKTAKKEAELVSDSITSERRSQVLSELKDLSKRKGRLETEIYQLNGDLARFEIELREHEATVNNIEY